MKEECQQLNEVIVDIALFFLHTDDVGWVEGLGPVQLHVLIEREKPKLEEVLYHYRNL